MSVTMQGGESLAERYARLARETPDRPLVDIGLRALDIVFATLFLLLSLPVALVIGIASLATTGRPIFYRGERVGRGGRVFTMTKFRTLNPAPRRGSGTTAAPLLVEQTEAEMTRMGRRLRATQLDEIPQLWHVLKGDMSLVGPARSGRASSRSSPPSCPRTGSGSWFARA